MKSPWTLIGWLIAGLFAMLLSLGLYLAGLALGWAPWLAPLFLWAPLLIAGLIQLCSWLLHRPVKASLPSLDASNPFTGQWETLKSGLGECSWELYLIVGDNDDEKRSFLNCALGEAEYQTSPAGPEGLSIWAAEGRAWLNVPAALWHEQAGGESSPSQSAGDWGHLIKLLPGFPGRLRGVLVLLDPQKLATDPEKQGLILSRKLAALANIPGTPPLWWLTLYPLESLPSGLQLKQALNTFFDNKNKMWQRPFGLFFSRRDNKAEALSETVSKAQMYLADSLNNYMIRSDYGPAPPQLACQVFNFMGELKQLPLSLLTAVVEANSKAKKIKCDGLFLSMTVPGGTGCFINILLKNMIPERTTGSNEPISRCRRYLGIWTVSVLFFIIFIALGAGYWKAAKSLTLAQSILPVLNQLESHPAGPIPIESLVAGTDLVIGLKNEAGGLAGLYRAPRKAAQLAKVRLTGQLNRFLPSEGGQFTSFTASLSDWADEHSLPLAFKHPVATIIVPGFATNSGRGLVVKLTQKWDMVFDQKSSARTKYILSYYDLKVFQQWHIKAFEAAETLKASPEKTKSAGANGLDGGLMGLDFLKAAGSELVFNSWRETPGWLMAARELEMIRSLSELGDLGDDRLELASVLKRIQAGGSPLQSGGIEKVIFAAKSWKKYETATRGLSGLTESPNGLKLLAEEMFSGAQAPDERASLVALKQLSVEAMTALEALSPIKSEADRELFEDLFYSPVTLMTKAAISAAAISLEDEWNRKILLPSKELPEAEKVELLLGEGGAVAAFRDGPARNYLVAEKKGYRPAEMIGEKFPWSDDFLKFINASQEGWKKTAGSDGRLKVSAILRPVRAEGNLVRSHPLGLAMEMVCEADKFKAESYNQPAAFTASWSPKTCDPLQINITFRDFKLTKIYPGSAGFKDFITAAVRGELRYTPDDFPDQKHLMKSAGAEAVVISLDINRGKEILKAINTPAPILKPPTVIISVN